MPIDVLGIVLALYLLSLLTVGMLFGMGKAKGYRFIVALQALIMLFSYLMAKNLYDSAVPLMSLIDGVEFGVLFVVSLALFAVIMLKHSRGERLDISFNTHLLGGVTLYLLIKLLATLSLYGRLPSYAEPGLYLMIAVGLVLAVYLRARRTRFL